MATATWSRLSLIALAAGLALATAVHAGVMEYGPVDKAVGDGPIALAVTPGDRVVAAVQETSPPVVGWFDTIDWREEATQHTPNSLTDARCIVAAGDASEPILLVGGDGVAVLYVDDSTAPATFTDGTTIGLSGAVVTALAWDGPRGVAYGADPDGLLHWIPVTGAGGSANAAAGWPLALGFAPRDLALLDPDTLLVAGDDGFTTFLALVSVAGDVPSIASMDLVGDESAPLAVATDPGTAWGWVLLASGEILAVEGVSVGDDDDSAGDDDDSAGDDDDSAGDDDDSAGDDDDSAGDDDDSAGGGARHIVAWTITTLSSSSPLPATDLLHAGGALYALGGATVRVLDPFDGAEIRSVPLPGAGAALAASSAADGHVYVALAELGQVSILGDAPFLAITAVAGAALDSDGEVVVTVQAGEVGDTGSCALSATLDGTIAGDGAVLGVSGTAILGEATDVTLPASALTEGSHRVFLFCADAEGDAGRASFTYTLSDLPVPADFAVQPGNARVEVSFTDAEDEDVAAYVLLFSTDGSFTDGATPTTCNSIDTLCSPLAIARPTVVGDPVFVDVTSLVNGAVYWFAVAAVDSAGNRGPLTEVLVTTPDVTGGVAALTGDAGCSCDSSPAARSLPASSFVAALSLLALRRRRGSWSPA